MRAIWKSDKLTPRISSWRKKWLHWQWNWKQIATWFIQIVFDFENFKITTKSQCTLTLADVLHNLFRSQHFVCSVTVRCFLLFGWNVESKNKFLNTEKNAMNNYDVKSEGWFSRLSAGKNIHSLALRFVFIWISLLLIRTFFWFIHFDVYSRTIFSFYFILFYFIRHKHIRGTPKLLFG